MNRFQETSGPSAGRRRRALIPGKGTAFSTLGYPGATPAEIIAVALRHGCEGVELRSSPSEFLRVGLSSSDTDLLRRDFERAGITVLAVTSYVELCTRAVDTPTDDQLADLVAHIGLASRLGSGGVRVFMNDEDRTGKGNLLSSGELRALGRLQAVSGLCDELGVNVLVETHDSHGRGGRLAAFFRALESVLPEHRCGVIWDTTHTWANGEDPATTFSLLQEWIAYIQLKDACSVADPNPVLPGDGSYPVTNFVRAIRGSRWEGWLSLEWELAWHPELASIDIALGAMKDWAPDLFTGRFSENTTNEA